MKRSISPFEAVFRKESYELWSNRALVYSFMGLVLFFVFVPAVLLVVIENFSPDDPNSPASPAIMQLTRLVPALEGMPRSDQAAILVVRHFTLIFLILPVIGALGSSTSSIVGEKQSRSIEPVLATPIRTFELLLGKSLATVILAVSGTWIGFALYVLLVWWASGTQTLRYSMDLTSLLMVLQQ